MLPCPYCWREFRELDNGSFPRHLDRLGRPCDGSNEDTALRPRRPRSTTFGAWDDMDGPTRRD